ncbi:uncharacterized protein [Patagioenas fasciata]|uniref:uncharacterized protein n=1 Tax=Patagioenas fasciata TaxID=372321 RepID=UPI003A99853E
MLPLWCLVLLGGLLPPCQGLLNLGSALGLSPAQPSDGLLGTGLLGSEGLISNKGGLLGTGLLGEGGPLGTSLLGRGSPSGEESGGPLGAGEQSSSSGILGTGLLGGQPGSSGLLGTGILGGESLGNGLLGNGLLSNKSLLGNGLLSNKSLLGDKGLLGTGILGGESLGNGLLGNGVLGNGLLGNTSLLGEKGLLGTGLLGKGALLGNGSLLDLQRFLGGGGLLDGELLGGGGLLGGGLLSNGVHHKSTHLAWLKALNLENVRVSWQILSGRELVLKLYSKLVLRLPGIFHFLSGSSVETNITSHIALTQDTPGDLRFMVRDCRNLLGGFRVNLRPGPLTNLVSRLLNSSLQTLVPALLCPLVNIWVSIINIKLQFLNRLIPFGLLGKIHSALSSLPLTSGQYVELDLQHSPFPGTFIDWLLQIAGVDPGSAE